MQDRYGLAPIALSGKEPIAQFVIYSALAFAVFFKPSDHHFFRRFNILAIDGKVFVGAVYMLAARLPTSVPCEDLLDCVGRCLSLRNQFGMRCCIWSDDRLNR